MSLVAVGTNYKYSPLELRERLSFSRKGIKDALTLLKEKEVFKGAVILSTCNRVEIYTSARYPKIAIEEITSFLSRHRGLEKRRFLPYLYIYEEAGALEHLFSVACGLDSQILGETQILAQVRFAFLEAEAADFADDFLKKIFSFALSFAKRMHSQTKLSEGKLSIGSIAIDFIKEKIGPLLGRKILIIGAGKVTELVLKYLKQEKPDVVFISNRTFEKAKELAGQIKAEVARFDNLKYFLKEADIVISATASPHFVIKKEHLDDREKELLIVDLALPRDVDPQIKEIKNISLFTLEDLDVVIKQNVEQRTREAEKVKWLIDAEVKRLWLKLTGLAAEPALLP